MIETAAGRLRWLRERSRQFRSAAEFARHISVPEVTYRAHESGLRGFAEVQARQYAGALAASWVWLLTGEGAIDPRKGKAPAPGPYGGRGDVDGAQPAPGGHSDLPVYASAERGPSGMIVTHDPIEWMMRSEPLLAVRDAFAIYVLGESMEPRYEQGDMILVHPTRPVQKGDDVLLLAHGEDGNQAALIKRLVSWSETAWTVQQYNPARAYDLPRTEWQRAYVIVGKYNRR
jgi:phage repressor protein C with HTH and peptisase S24 domain